MRPRGVLGLVLAGVLLLAGLGLYRLQQAHEPSVAEAVAASCDAPTLLEALRRDGYDDAGYRLEHIRCEGSYAYALAVPADDQLEPADSLYRYRDGRWTFLTLGTSIGTAKENHVPFEVFDRLMPADRPR